MKDNETLNEKHRTQRRLAQEANHNIPTLSKNAHDAVPRIEQLYGLKFKYGKIEGGYLEPAIPKRSSS